MLRFLISAIAVVAFFATARAENIVFPELANVADAKQDYGAVGDGFTDDTAAIQAALDAGHHLIYLPDGVYLVSDTIRWSEGNGKGSAWKRQVLQGQSEGGTVIRLNDQCQGFGESSSPKPVVWTGKAPAQRFRNSLRSLTIETGKGNPGAIGLQFIANNQGGLFDVTIRSGDGSGPIGLDLGYSDEQGPCLMKNVTVEGFDVGVRTKHAVDSVTFENLTLSGQSDVGFRNDSGQCVSIRGLKSTNRVTAYHNGGGPSLTAMIDSELTGEGVASGLPAITNGAGLFARNIRTTGYAKAIENNGGTKQGADGPQVGEFVSHEVATLFPTAKKSLNLPIEETPVVPWHPLEDWASVTAFGPPKTIELVRQKDGKKQTAEDWSEALQRAIDSGSKTVYFPAKKEGGYGIYGPVRLRGNVERIIGCEVSLGKVVESTEHATIYQPESRTVFIIEDGAAPAVIVERFDTWYGAPRFEQCSKRALVIASMSFYELETEPGSGPVFLEDVRSNNLTVRGSKLWGRQVNIEGHAQARIVNDGGQTWILGLKTENDPILAHIKNGARSEFVGGFAYANKNHIPDKVMFINDDSAMSLTIGEWVTKKGRAFPVIVRETQGEETRLLKRSAVRPRGHGSMVPLYVGGSE